MEVEHATKVFQLDNQEELENNIKAMTADGWLLMPGVAPVAIYHVVRLRGGVPQSDDGSKPVARITIDDTKVKILRGGQLVDE